MRADVIGNGTDSNETPIDVNSNEDCDYACDRNGSDTGDGDDADDDNDGRGSGVDVDDDTGVVELRMICFIDHCFVI